MEQPVEITRKEWLDLINETYGNGKQIKYHADQLERHSGKIDSIEKQQIALPLSIQQAVENGMAPVLEKVLEHDGKFNEIELRKEREEKEAALARVKSNEDQKKWFYRAIVGALVAAVVGGVASFYIALFLSNLRG